MLYICAGERELMGVDADGNCYDSYAEAKCANEGIKVCSKCLSYTNLISIQCFTTQIPSKCVCVYKC